MRRRRLRTRTARSDATAFLLCVLRPRRVDGLVRWYVVGVKIFVDATTALVRLFGGGGERGDRGAPTVVASFGMGVGGPCGLRTARSRRRRRRARAPPKPAAALALRHGARVGLGGWRWRSGRAYTGQRAAPAPQMLSQIGERVRHLFVERFEAWARGHSAVLAWPTGRAAPHHPPRSSRARLLRQLPRATLVARAITPQPASNCTALAVVAAHHRGAAVAARLRSLRVRRCARGQERPGAAKWRGCRHAGGARRDRMRHRRRMPGMQPLLDRRRRARLDGGARPVEHSRCDDATRAE